METAQYSAVAFHTFSGWGDNSENIDNAFIRGEPNNGSKEANPNILSLVFGSYNWRRIVQKGFYQPDTEYWISVFVLKETKLFVSAKYLDFLTKVWPNYLVE